MALAAGMSVRQRTTMLLVVPHCKYGPRRMVGQGFGAGVVIGLGGLGALVLMVVELVDATVLVAPWRLCAANNKMIPNRPMTKCQGPNHDQTRRTNKTDPALLRSLVTGYW